MNIETFEKKHEDLFELGACAYNKLTSGEQLIIDRYIDGKFVCDRIHIDKAQADARRMGFNSYGVGTYFRPF